MRKRDARDVAADAITAFRKRGAWSDGYLRNEMRASGLSERDAALATVITNGVLQNMIYIDFCISKFSDIRVNKISPGILDVLRISVYQILFLDRVPDSAVVNDAVSRAKRSNARAAGFVNAILRKISASKSEMPQIDGGKEDVLSVKYSHPLWLVHMLSDIYGIKETEKILSENNKSAKITARVNVLKTDTKELLDALREEGVSADNGAIENAVVMESTGAIERLSAFKNGLFHVQDTASQIAAEAVCARPGMRILDVCAAPGGKTFLISESMNNSGDVVSCDIHEHKLQLIEDGAKRLGLRNIKTKLCDASVFNCDFESAFDAVLADVPCSGLGIIRKKPDIRYKDAEDIKALPNVQKSILRNVSRYVKRGGTLVYSTCTILPAENSDIVADFLRTNDEFEEITLKTEIPNIKNEFGNTFLPHISGTDGFYICRLRRKK